MLRKNNEKRGCFASLIWIPIAIVVMFCIAGYGMSQGINVPGILSSGFNVISKGEHANSSDVGKLFGRFIPKSESSETGNSSSKTSGVKSGAFSYSPLPFENHKLMANGDLDSLGRATYGHIRLKYSDKPQDDRESKINVDPVGWHNYRFKYEDESGKVKKAYLMNRGHLIGYQFSGLNSEIKNLVPMTHKEAAARRSELLLFLCQKMFTSFRALFSRLFASLFWRLSFSLRSFWRSLSSLLFSFPGAFRRSFSSRRLCRPPAFCRPFSPC